MPIMVTLRFYRGISATCYGASSPCIDPLRMLRVIRTMACPLATPKSCTTYSQSLEHQSFRRHFRSKVFTDVKEQFHSHGQWTKPVGVDTPIAVYNTLTQTKIPLVLRNEGQLTWYVCGPTVYDEAHIGHACTYVRLDAIRRILSSMFNINVVYMMGITDIDDKIVHKAKQVGVSPSHLARQYESSFLKSMSLLNVAPPSVTQRVTDSVPQIVHFIVTLIEKGKAYCTHKGNVYFDISSYDKYGCFSKTGTCGTSSHEIDASDKKNSKDFALWKSAAVDEPSWPSPWGQGRPGWHIECSVMASHVFGGCLDFHSGGEDLIFPHHENELAQSQAYHQSEQWVNYWLHTGSLHSRSDAYKMSKSLGNTISISELLKTYSSNQFRVFCLLSPYRNSVEFDTETMKKPVRMLSQMRAVRTLADAYVKGINSSLVNCDEALLSQSLVMTQRAVRQALADDFDTPSAFRAVMNLVHVTNIELSKRSKVERGSSVGTIVAIANYIDSLMSTLGVNLSLSTHSEQDTQRIVRVVDATVAFREKVRNFCLAGDLSTASDNRKLEIKSHRKAHAPLLKDCDQLRDELESLCGVAIKDTKDRSHWEFVETEPPADTPAVATSKA